MFKEYRRLNGMMRQKERRDALGRGVSVGERIKWSALWLLLCGMGTPFPLAAIEGDASHLATQWPYNLAQMIMCIAVC